MPSVKDLEKQIKSLQKSVEVLTAAVQSLTEADTTFIDAASVDVFYLIVMGMLVFFMQGGFALLEAGSVRKKNVVNITIKNVLDGCIGALAYWLIGYGIAYGEKDYIVGEGNHFIGDNPDLYLLVNFTGYASWWYQYTFAATATTIVSGSIAERGRFESYIIYSFFMTAFVYPVVSHWVWCPSGWLFRLGFIDFAGSGVVHLCGGAASIMAAIICGPRIGRFGDGGGPIAGHSVLFAATGVFILWLGFFAFNCGSTLGISLGRAAIAERVAINTALASASGALAGLLITRLISGKFSLLYSMNCLLAGLVGICSSCAVVDPWASVVIGAVSAIVYLAGSKLLIILKIDDPVDAGPLHFGAGSAGLILTSFFAKESHMDQVYGPDYGPFGIFYGGRGVILGYQIAGWCAIVGWTAVLMGLTFLLLRVCKILRVSEEIELEGLDTTKHGEEAYPVERVHKLKKQPTTFLKDL